jgi:SAM-dependent methyltransferase
VTASRAARTEWPIDGLENVDTCPVCDSPTRRKLHEGLTDNTFFVAAGEWSLWRCSSCRSAYLNPRPNEQTIGLAYSYYYTHSSAVELRANSLVAKLRLSLGNDYRNARYGTRFRPAIRLLGRTAVKLIPKVRDRIDIEYRSMPRPTQEARLLDVGCGNGDFLRVAMKAGWCVAGVEPDPESRAIAHKLGADVRPSLNDWPENEHFQHITASHVIEHVHDPRLFLEQLNRLLVPGGMLYIQTPNLDAPTYLRFGRHWRGLEPPRHLVLFTKDSLVSLLQQTGFDLVRSIPSPGAAAFLIEQSERIAHGLDPYSGLEAPTSGNVDQAPHVAHDPRGEEEFLTMVAVKR